MSAFKEAVKELVRDAFRANNAEDKKDEKEVMNEDVDKRDIIRQIMAIAGKHEDNEDVRTIAKLAEKLAYDRSEAGTADNKKAKNADEEEKEEKFEEEKEIAENKCKAKNEEEDKKEDEKDKKDEKAENKCKNSMDDVRKAVFGGKSEIKSEYIPHSQRIEMGNNY